MARPAIGIRFVDDESVSRQALAAALSPHAEGTLLRISSKPKSNQESLDVTAAGVVLKIRDPATEGQANARLVEVIASLLDTRKTDVEVKSGMTSRHKAIFVAHLTPHECLSRLLQRVDGLPRE